MSEARAREARKNGLLGGRPATGRDATVQIGRVSAPDHAELRAAARDSGKTLTAWATSRLLAAARRESKRRLRAAALRDRQLAKRGGE